MEYGDWPGYELPNVNTIVYPNTMKEFYTVGFRNTQENKCIKKIILSESLQTIEAKAFFYCENLNDVTIPNSVTSIERQAFSWCSALTSVTIPSSVTSIGDLAFYGCANLKTVNFRGTQEEWSKITIGTNNTALNNAKINYNYTGK